MNKSLSLIVLALTCLWSWELLAMEKVFKKLTLAPTLEAIVEEINRSSSVKFQLSDFLKIEERSLATSRFTMYVQHAEQIPVKSTAIRIWSHPQDSTLILAEVHLDEEAKAKSSELSQKYFRAHFSKAALKSSQLNLAIQSIVRSEIAGHATDNRVLGFKFQDYWLKGELVREARVRSRRGEHIILVSLFKNKIIEKFYMEFPQAEQFQTFKANVYPIYEEVENTGEKLPFEVKELKYVHSHLADGGEDPLYVLKKEKYPESRYSPILAETEYGRLNQIWSEVSLRRKVEEILQGYPLRSNQLSDGVLLQGKYVTINLHPGVKSFKEVHFPLTASNNHLLQWDDSNGEWEAQVVSGLNGKKFFSEDELIHRVPERLPDHDPVSYINSGFDEVQVYYGVTVLMEALGEMGFEDPELSTKPFHAFLYDPDIGMKDNAYYYDNTINFTTYNSSQPNLARDNPTIWHELGHGIMDRLMGAHLGFADSKGGYGGLSEGMADFLAKIILEHQTRGNDFPGKNDFRVINNTGFYLTNEFHDEGESYGGAMSDMLDEAIVTFGREGLYDFADLTLEAMRLTRNHPALTARSWFEHMLYADELGSDVRDSNQFSDLILKALKQRNFSFETNFQPASMKISFEHGELTNSSLGSRENPVTNCGDGETVTHRLSLRLTPGTGEFIKFPAMVKVEFKKGALQGAIRWEGEEENPLIYMVNSPEQVLPINLKAALKCEQVNQPDGSCKDYAYIQVLNSGSPKPLAKKRFYLKLNPARCQGN